MPKMSSSTPSDLDVKRYRTTIFSRTRPTQGESHEAQASYSVLTPDLVTLIDALAYVAAKGDHHAMPAAANTNMEQDK